MSVQFLCVIRCFQSAPVALGSHPDVCVFLYGATKTSRSLWTNHYRLGAGRVWTVVDMENGHTHIHHSYPEEETCACSLNWIANARPWCEKENYQRGEERVSLPGKSQLCVGEKSELRGSHWWSLLSVFRRGDHCGCILAIMYKSVILLRLCITKSCVFGVIEYSS